MKGSVVEIDIYTFFLNVLFEILIAINNLLYALVSAQKIFLKKS